MPTLAIRLAALALPLGILSAGPIPLRLPNAPAAPATAAAEEAPAEPEAPKPASIPTLARTLEEGLSRVRFLERTVESSPAPDEVERSLPEIGTRMSELETKLSGIQPTQTSLRELNMARIDFMEVDSTLSGWESSLEAYATELDAARAELRTLEETWQATLTSE